MDFCTVEKKNGTSVRILTLSRSREEAFTARIALCNPAGREEVEFVLLEEYCCEMGLELGEIEAVLLPEIEYWAQVTEGYFSACASFAYAPSSLQALLKKLIQKGFSRDVAKDAISVLRRRGYVNEEEIACRRGELFIAKLWGPVRIFAKLREEGFGESALKAVKSSLDEVDFVCNCRALIAKKYGDFPRDSSPGSRHSRELICASLVRMGYSLADIKKAMRAETDQ